MFVLNASKGGKITINLPFEITSALWLDDKSEVAFTTKNGAVSLQYKPFNSGINEIVRIAKLVCK